MSEFVSEPVAGEDKICRYCFEGEDEGELISPCNVCGEAYMKYIH